MFIKPFREPALKIQIPVSPFLPWKIGYQPLLYFMVERSFDGICNSSEEISDSTVSSVQLFRVCQLYSLG
jgi:hypothetical protein